MKNKFFILLTSLFFSGTLLAQTGRLGGHANITQWTAPAGITSTEQGKEIAERIIDAIGLRSNFDVRPANIENAAAVVYSGKRYVLYNPTFINNLIKTTGTDWAAISVLAHEIGHHLNGHTVTGSGSQHTSELEADEFSGFVLRKMGSSLTQAQAAMKTLASNKASRTHPAQYDRLSAIAQGWHHADDQLAGRQSVRKNLPAAKPQREPAIINRGDVASTTSRIRLDSRQILGDVHFSADPGNTYHVTTGYNLVKVGSSGISILGKLTRLNSSQYPYLIHDRQNTQLLVDKRGNIVTRSGKPVGILKNHDS